MYNDPIFNTKLTQEEIENNFAEFDIFEGLVAGLQEAFEYEKGKARAETFARKRSLPTIDVVKVRTELQMTQKGFASILGVSCRTVESWECGKSTPTPTAKKLIYLIANDPSLVKRLQTE